MKRLVSLSILISLSLIACNSSRLSPIAPTDSGGFPPNENPTIQRAISEWSPYLHVHTDGVAINAYRDSFSLMKRAGKLKGIRVEINPGGQSLNNPVIRMASSLNIEVLALISNYFLFDLNIENRIDEIFAAYPEIRYFQIGNETTSILSAPGPMMTTEEYMVVLKKIYAHVQFKHPGRAVLLTYSTLGSGLRGPTELEKMADLGLTEMSPNKIIISINSYDSPNTSTYFGVLNGPLRRYRVWIPETGIADPSLHISYVADNYQNLKNYLRAERIYWYVAWGGDSGSDTDFSLIKNPKDYPNYWKSPLLKALTGVQ